MAEETLWRSELQNSKTMDNRCSQKEVADRWGKKKATSQEDRLERGKNKNNENKEKKKKKSRH